MKTEDKRTLGSVRRISLNLSSPAPFNVDMIDVRELMILVGANGTGKTFVLKSVWVMSSIAAQYLTARKMMGSGMPQEQLKATAQFMLDNTFVEHKIDGMIKMEFDGGGLMSILTASGKVESVACEFMDDIESAGIPVFMSKDTRLVEDFGRYMKTKRMAGIPSGMPNAENIVKILDMYRIYDVVYMERLLKNIEFDLTDDILSRFNSCLGGFDDKFQVSAIKVDYEKCDILYLDPSETEYRSASRLGAGHQSIFTMFLAQSF